MKQYDEAKYRALGIGERVEDGDYYISPSIKEPARCASTIGKIVSQDDVWVYLRPIEAVDQFPTGAKRSAAAGRGRFDLVPYEAMLSLARRYEMGAEKFGDNNWLKGQPLSRLLSSMRRHAHQLNYDFSEDHAGAVLWNAAAFVTMVSRMEAGILPRDLDDIGWFSNMEATKQ
jgi:hypothetical protein